MHSRISTVVTLFIALILCVSQEGLAQTFYQTYSSGNKLEGACIIASPDGNLFVGGRKDDSAFVMKIDPAGEILWKLSFRDASATTPLYVTSMEITPDNFLIGTGVGITPSNLFPTDGFYFKIALNGTVQFCHAITGLGYRFSIRKMLALTSSSYVLVAAHEESAGTWYDPIVIRVNGLTGAVVSQSPRYDFENLYLDDISESVLSPDKKFIYSTGRLYVNGASPDQMRIFLTRFDTLGALQWTKFFVYPQTGAARMYGSNVVYDNDTLVIANFGDNNGTSSNFELGLLKADTAGNMIWAKNYDITSTTFERSFRLLKTNYGYAVVGTCTGTSTDNFILALSSQGDVLWCKSYGTAANEDHVNAFGALPATMLNNDVYFTGVRKTSATESKLIVARTDVAGELTCLIPDILNVVTTTNPVYTEQRVVTSFADPVAFAPVTVFTEPVINLCEGVTIDLGTDTSFCTGSLILDATTPGASYSWQDGSTSSTFTAASAGLYHVSVFLDCCVLNDTIEILSAGSVLYSASISLCVGDSFSYGGSFFHNDASFTDTLTSTTGCDSIVDVSLSFEMPPTVTITSPPVTCAGSPSTLSAVGASQYLWQPASGLVCSTCANTSFVPTANVTYTVTGSSANGCEGYDTVDIAVFNQPVIEVVDPQFSTCEYGVALSVIGEDWYQYSWTPAELIENPNADSTFAYPEMPTTFTVTATDTTGCSVSAEVPVDYSNGGIVAIPNAFSPNDDGINDIYRLIFFCPIDLEHFRIFNRWGQKVFETNDVDHGWNGIYKMKECEVGVYAYVVAGKLSNGEAFFLKGNVTLLR